MEEGPCCQCQRRKSERPLSHAVLSPSVLVIYPLLHLLLQEDLAQTLKVAFSND